jgi:uncharacterized protein YfaT (DUF1175 family)
VRAFLLTSLLALLAGCGGAPRDEAAVAVPGVSDSVGDGTPDFLRLDAPEDRVAFVRWFTFLGEVQYFQEPQDLPRDVADCAGLIRFAYREALREHDGAWATALKLPLVPAIPPVKKYRYPFTPLKASLFRVVGGSYQEQDRSSGAFAEFADARTLRRYNTHFVTRDLRYARPGDLLFFEQAGQNLPFHAMIYLGQSQIEPGSVEYVVYHTGPAGNERGEIRRPSVAELLEHPLPQWRPVAGNSSFLGVSRWNILREGS